MTQSADPAEGFLILRLPSLVAGRDLADTMLDRLSPSYRGRSVIIDASRTSSASPSFSGQLVQHVLVDGQAASLMIAGAPQRMVDVVTEVSTHAGMAGRVQVVDHMPRRAQHAPA